MIVRTSLSKFELIRSNMLHSKAKENYPLFHDTQMKVTFSTQNGQNFDIELNPEQKVSDVKKVIAKNQHILPKQIRIFDSSNKIAKNTQIFKDLGYGEGSKVSIIVVEEQQKPKEEPTPTDFLNLFNKFVKHIQDQSGGEETQTEILLLVEKPKIQEMFEYFSNEPELFRDAIEQNEILQMNRPLENCIVDTFGLLGATCAPKPDPITIDTIINIFGIPHGEELKEKIANDPELASIFDEIKQAMIVCGGISVFTKKTKRQPVDLEKIFAPLLLQFQSMGFYDTKENLRAIEEGGGDLDASIQWILNKQENRP